MLPSRSGLCSASRYRAVQGSGCALQAALATYVSKPFLHRYSGSCISRIVKVFAMDGPAPQKRQKVGSTAGPTPYHQVLDQLKTPGLIIQNHTFTVSRLRSWITLAFLTADRSKGPAGRLSQFMAHRQGQACAMFDVPSGKTLVPELATDSAGCSSGSALCA